MECSLSLKALRSVQLIRKTTVKKHASRGHPSTYSFILEHHYVPGTETTCNFFKSCCGISTKTDRDRVKLDNLGDLQKVSCINVLAAGPHRGEALELAKVGRRRRGFSFPLIHSPINSTNIY